MEGEEAEVRRRPLKRLIALVFLLIFTLILAALWAQRAPIAGDFIDRELARRGVQASYEVRRIGFGTQRLENLVIGDPRRPDLSAKWVEIELSWGLRAPRIGTIRARGVQMAGRVVNGRLSLGQIDRLLPPPSGLPFRLPDQDIDVADFSLRLDTPAGRIGIGLAGKGNLADGFRGKMAAASPALRLDGCAISRAAVYLEVAVSDLRPSLKGPTQAAQMICSGFELERPQVRIDVALAEALDSWRGKAAVNAASARFGGNVMNAVAGNVSLDGDKARTGGRIALASAASRLGDFNASRITVEGRYALSPAQGRLWLIADASGGGLAGGQATAGPLIAALSSAGGSPVEPVGDALAAAIARALRGFDAGGSLRLVHGPDGGAVRFDRMDARSRSGAALAVSGGEGISFYWPRASIRVDGDFALSGGGLPAARFSLRQARGGAPISGTGRIAPMTAGGARVAFGEIKFAGAAGGTTSIETVASVDGPFNDGRVTGLIVPIRGRIGHGGAFVLGEGCTNIGFRALQAGGLRLDSTRLPLCPSGRAILWRNRGGSLQGGADIRSPRLVGRLGESPLSLVSDRVRFSIADGGFTSSRVAVRLGKADAVSRLDLASLSGRFNKAGVTGDFSGASAKLANIPLLIGGGSGSWQIQGGKVLVAGSMSVADEANPVRFHPLATSDFRLTLIDNEIEAGGWLHDPETGIRVAEARIDHSLRTGRGNALIDVPGIAFTENFQPEQLTPLTVGVVTLVNGVVKGKGEIHWDEKGSGSSGSFGTEDMDLAAAFGPVEGLATNIHFTDLLGLVSAPDQTARVGLIRTGVDVLDGAIRYQLLPDLRVRIEAGRWPFAGGELVLEETILDFSQRDRAKQLTFRVVGLDGAAFVQLMEFSNISATGTFDGVVPMIFDPSGGRIVGGRLEARPAGGTLSYIGELSDRELGAYGKLAFDALKSLRYNKLVMGLDGSLDGEFLTTVELDGIARNPSLATSGSGGISGMVVGRALNQLAKIPFEFNITIRGPFRSLFATARSFEDPSNLILLMLPEELRTRIGDLSVQPKESEAVP